MKNTLRFVLLSLVIAGTTLAERPNVVIIFMDDMGYADIGKTNNAAADHPEVVERLTKLIKNHSDEMEQEARMPGLLNPK
jgi:arylsulfatase A-like enzyme